jgi:hypothetical protein
MVEAESRRKLLCRAYISSDGDEVRKVEIEIAKVPSSYISFSIFSVSFFASFFCCPYIFFYSV